MDKQVKYLLIFLSGTIIVWCFSFFLFFYDAISFRNVSDEQCDNIVVLTGDKNRIPHALNNIRRNKPENIFISGVYTKTRIKDIIGDSKITKNVNFILGKQATNTFENAEEINNWVRSNKINRIILVTSDYHMRRSILVLHNINKNLEIIPCASKSQFDFHFFIICLKEFHKTVYVFCKNLVGLK
ncbi:MAG: YdcF family protein [Alphaproteobacteria bacterium]|nr:YdcF family protein [Alphaproteobacteria bacterium]